MFRLRDRFDRQGTPVSWQQGNVQLKHGEWVTWQLTNRGRVAVDVTLLFVDSLFGIEPLFPRPGLVTDNRLLPGQSLRTIAARVNAEKSVGMEQVVVIAMVADGPPVDFTLLAQPTVDAARRAATRGATQPLDTPLGRLLARACYASGGTRGLDAETAKNYQMQLVAWRVLPTATSDALTD